MTRPHFRHLDASIQEILGRQDKGVEEGVARISLSGKIPADIQCQVSKNACINARQKLKGGYTNHLASIHEILGAIQGSIAL